MNYRYLLSIILVAFIFIPVTGWGQVLFDINKIKFDPSKLFPIISDEDIIEAPNGYISTQTITKIKDRCLSRVPERFPPQAHQSYCSCSAAATQATMRVKDIVALQEEDNRKLGNSAFEKYVANVMKPCFEDSIIDVEFMQCMMSHNTDWRVRLPIPYCNCVSKGVDEHFKKFGLEEMMIGWGYPDKMEYESPIDTLWKNETFLKARESKKDACVGNYFDPRYYKR